MLVLITYDVNTETDAGKRRLRILDNAQCVSLKAILEGIIDKEVDSLRFYYLGNNYKTKVEHFGVDRGTAADSTLIF